MDRVAAVRLRGQAGMLRARAHWPPTGPGALLVLYAAGGADALCRDLCSRVGVVVLAMSCPPVDEAVTAVEWAADHAAELDADPDRLFVAGVGVGANLAAAVARHAADNRWPAITRQALIFATLADTAAARLLAEALTGPAPATVITVDGDPLGDDGRQYVVHLRRSAVEVNELRYLTGERNEQ